MPTPPPPEHTRWPPGTSGNPAGYSNRRRVSDALVKLIEKHGADAALAQVWLGAALGNKKLLGDHKPDFRFFKELLDRIEGPVRDRSDEDDGPPEPPKDADGNPISP